MNEFVVVFRESLEAALIVGIISTTLVKMGRREALRGVWRGLILASAASLVLGAAMYGLGEASAGKAWSAGMEALMLFVAAGFMFYMVVWMAQRQNIGAKLAAGTKDALLAGGASLTIFVFFVVVREGFETVLFLFSVAKLQGGMSVASAISGAAVAAVIAYLLFLRGKKMPLKPYFRWTSMFLLILGAGMVAYGVHELEECLTALGWVDETQISRPYVWFPPVAEPPSAWYDPVGEKYVHWFHDKGRVGKYLKMLFGYNSDPNWPELMLWGGSLTAGGVFWWRAQSKK
jgi:high-affinity iron transporter